MNEVIILTGYPASGKSSVASLYIAKGYVHLNRDSAGGKVVNLLPVMERELKGGNNVILDNTFPTVESRQPFIQAAKKIGAKVISEWISTSIEEAQFNACLRMMKLKGEILDTQGCKDAKHPNLFPPAVLFKYKKEFEKPSTKEGFDECNIAPFRREFPTEWNRKGLFLDYDGTIRETISGAKWPSNPSDIRILPNRKKVIKEWIKKGYQPVCVSNQSGIAKGNPTREQAIACFQKTNELLGIEIPIFFCPHRVPPVSCYCRKPMPGMAVRCFHDMSLDPRQSIMVGDMTSDSTFANRSHMHFIHADEFFAEK